MLAKKYWTSQLIFVFLGLSIFILILTIPSLCLAVDDNANDAGCVAWQDNCDTITSSSACVNHGFNYTVNGYPSSAGNPNCCGDDSDEFFVYKSCACEVVNMCCPEDKPFVQAGVCVTQCSICGDNVRSESCEYDYNEQVCKSEVNSWAWSMSTGDSSSGCWQNMCCGDDNYEAPSHCNSSPLVGSGCSIYDRACCNSATGMGPFSSRCVYNGNCYSMGIYSSVGVQPDLVTLCEGNYWIDLDEQNGTRVGVVTVLQPDFCDYYGYDWCQAGESNVGEYDANGYLTQCCGDDVNEYYKDGICCNSDTDINSNGHCCPSGKEWNGIACEAPAYCGDNITDSDEYDDDEAGCKNKFSTDAWAMPGGDSPSGCWQNMCCGDDSQENFTFRQVRGSDFGISSDINDQACCASFAWPGCVYNNQCYSSGSIVSDIICRTGMDYLGWNDCDYGFRVIPEQNPTLGCEVDSGCGTKAKAGEASVGEYNDMINYECCGDDANEYYKDGICCNSDTDINSNGHCCPSGTVWNGSACELLQAPEITLNSPADSSSCRDKNNTKLNFTVSDNGSSIRYLVYFGTSSNPPLVYTSSYTSYTSPSTFEYSPSLSYNTTYYWKIAATDGVLDSQSAIQTFTTQVCDPSDPCCESDGCSWKSPNSQPDGYTDTVECEGTNSCSGSCTIKVTDYYCNSSHAVATIIDYPSTCGLCYTWPGGTSWQCNQCSNGTTCGSNPGKCCSGVCDTNGTRGEDYYSSCKSTSPSCISTGNWGYTAINQGAECGSAQDQGDCDYPATCDAEYYYNTCASGYCTSENKSYHYNDTPCDTATVCNSNYNGGICDNQSTCYSGHNVRYCAGGINQGNCSGVIGPDINDTPPPNTPCDNKDCGVCCICDNNISIYDSGQDSDCVATTCNNGCDTAVPSRYRSAPDATNYCSGLKECTTNSCAWSYTCDQSLAGGCSGWECDDDSDCGPAQSCSSQCKCVGGDAVDPVVSSLNVNGTTVSNDPLYTTDSTPTINWTVTDSGGSYLDFVQVYRRPNSNPSGWVDVSGDLNAPANSNSWSSNWTDSLADGNYWYGLHVNDNAGNYADGQMSGVDPIQVIIDRQAPSVSVTGAPADWQNTNASASIACADNGSAGCDSTTYRLKTYTSSGSCSTNYADYTLNYPQTITSRTWVCAAAKDRAGNIGFSPTRIEFKVETTDPSTPNCSPSPGTYSSARNISFSSSDSGGSGLDVIRYTTDGTDPDLSDPVYSSPINISADTNFKARAWDNAGNDSGVKSCNYDINITVPDFSISVSPSGNNTEEFGNASFNVTVNSSYNYSQPVSLSASGAPSGAIVAFNSSILTPPANGSISTELSLSGCTPDGDYLITISGTDGTKNHSASPVSLIVSACSGDCGTCCSYYDSGSSCDRSYDDSQDGDCAATSCNDSCDASSRWRYAPDAVNYCSSLDACTTNSCAWSYTCDQSLAGGCSGWECDDDGDCGTGTCNLNNCQCTTATDTTAPVVAALDVNGTTIGSTLFTQDSTPTINWTVTDSGGSYLDFVQVYRRPNSNPSGWVDVSGDLNAPANSNSWSSNWTDSLADGNYWYGLHVNDNAGNYADGQMSGVDPIQVIIDRQAPSVSVTGAPADWQNTNASASIACADNGSAGCDSTTYRLKTYTSSGSCSTNYADYTLNYPQTITSRTWVCAAAKDRAGNIGFSPTRIEFKVETTDPSTPNCSPSPGTYSSARNISFSSSDSGGSGLDVIRYTTDGTDPDLSDPVYSSPINISADTNFKARAWDNAGNDSGVKSCNYIIDLPGVNPDFSINLSPSGHTVNQGGNVSYNITINSIDGFSSPVNLSATGIPPGANYWFGTSPITPPADSSVSTNLSINNCSPDGNYSIVVAGSSGSLSHNAPAVNLTVNTIANPSNNDPVLNPIGLKNIAENNTLEFNFYASDSDNDMLTFSCFNLPSGANCTNHGTYGGGYGSFNWPIGYDDAGDYTNVRFQVDDSQGGSDYELITINVDNLNRPPNNPSNGSPVTPPDNPPTNTDFSFTGGDPDGDNDSITYDSTIFDNDDNAVPGCSGSKVVGGNTSSIIFTNNELCPTGSLDPNTSYSWKVQATDNSGASSSIVSWDFTTEAVYTGDLTADFNWCVMDMSSEVKFKDMSEQGSYPITSWDWDFGDDNSSSIQDPSHTYDLSEGGDWWHQDWGHRMKITFDNRGREAFENIPVLIKLTPSNFDFNEALGQGQDIRFVDSDDSTELKYEVESWKHNDIAYVWVKVPRIDADSNTDFIYQYYDNQSTNSNEDPPSVWDNDYAMVQHLEDTTADDSTGLNSGSSNGGLSKTNDGKINGANYFDGNNDDISVPDSSSLDITDAITLEVWGKGPAVWRERMITKGGEIYVLRREQGNSSGSYLHGYLSKSGSLKYAQSSSRIISNNNFHYMVLTWDGTSAGDKKIKLYNNGSEVSYSQQDSFSAPLDTSSQSLYIGSHGSGEYFKGVLDEVRISSVARSSDWVDFQYCAMTGGSCIVYSGAEPKTSSSSDFDVTLDVYDSNGGADSITKTITVDDANICQPFNITQGMPVSDSEVSLVWEDQLINRDYRFFYYKDSSGWFSYQEVTPDYNCSNGSCNTYIGNLEQNTTYVFIVRADDFGYNNSTAAVNPPTFLAPQPCIGGASVSTESNWCPAYIRTVSTAPNQALILRERCGALRVNFDNLGSEYESYVIKRSINQNMGYATVTNDGLEYFTSSELNCGADCYLIDEQIVPEVVYYYLVSGREASGNMTPWSNPSEGQWSYCYRAPEWEEK